jgi:hypothetical protein
MALAVRATNTNVSVQLISPVLCKVVPTVWSTPAPTQAARLANLLRTDSASNGRAYNRIIAWRPLMWQPAGRIQAPQDSAQFVFPELSPDVPKSSVRPKRLTSHGPKDMIHVLSAMATPLSTVLTSLVTIQSRPYTLCSSCKVQFPLPHILIDSEKKKFTTSPLRAHVNIIIFVFDQTSQKKKSYFFVKKSKSFFSPTGRNNFGPQKPLASYFMIQVFGMRSSEQLQHILSDMDTAWYIPPSCSSDTHTESQMIIYQAHFY